MFRETIQPWLPSYTLGTPGPGPLPSLLHICCTSCAIPAVALPSWEEAEVRGAQGLAEMLSPCVHSIHSYEPSFPPSLWERQVSKRTNFPLHENLSRLTSWEMRIKGLTEAFVNIGDTDMGCKSSHRQEWKGWSISFLGDSVSTDFMGMKCDSEVAREYGKSSLADIKAGSQHPPLQELHRSQCRSTLHSPPPFALHS